MTLTRQLIAVLSAMFLLVFSGTFYAGMDGTRHYLNERLQIQAAEAAVLLARALLPPMARGDRRGLESTLAGFFGDGSYREIGVEGTDGVRVVARTPAAEVEGVPAWFVQAMPLAVARAEARIGGAAGEAGRVWVESRPGGAYRALWASVTRAFWWSAAILALSAALGALVLGHFLRPLRRMEAQALAAAERPFPRLEPVSGSRELERLVAAFNRMSAKAQALLAEQTALAEHLRREAYVDELTGTANRRAFHRHLGRLLAAPDEYAVALLVVRVAGLERVNRERGYSAGDVFLRAVGQLLRTRFAGENAFVARIGSSEFAVLLTGVDRDTVAGLATRTLRELGALRHADLQGTGAHIGIAGFSGRRTASGLLAEADMALRYAQQRGPREWHLFEPERSDMPVAVRGAEEWRSTLGRVLAQRHIVLTYQAVETPDLARVYHHEVLARIRGEAGGLVPAAMFMPMAERMGLATDLDRLIVEAALEDIGRRGADERFAVNLSGASLADARFTEWLVASLSAHRSLAPRLAFEVAEYTAYAHLERLRALVPRLHALGARFGIDHFGVGAPSFGYVQSLGVDYVKIDGSFIVDLEQDRDNQFFLRVLTEVMRGLDIDAIAEFVETQAQLRVLRELRVDAVQGYFVVKPEPVP